MAERPVSFDNDVDPKRLLLQGLTLVRDGGVLDVQSPPLSFKLPEALLDRW